MMPQSVYYKERITLPINFEYIDSILGCNLTLAFFITTMTAKGGDLYT